MEGKPCTDLHTLSGSSLDSNRAPSRKTLRPPSSKKTVAGQVSPRLVLLLFFLFPPKFLGCD